MPRFISITFIIISDFGGPCIWILWILNRMVTEFHTSDVSDHCKSEQDLSILYSFNGVAVLPQKLWVTLLRISQYRRMLAS